MPKKKFRELEEKMGPERVKRAKAAAKKLLEEIKAKEAKKKPME